MAIDVSAFHLHNIADTCAVWNVLSSRRLFYAALDAGVVFVCTGVVVYECLHKPRQNGTKAERELQARFEVEKKALRFKVYPLDIEDLQMVQILENRKRLGKGELSSIAFAMKTRQPVLTDDQKARKLMRDVLPNPGAQTTPHLLGWLFFTNRMIDSDKDAVIREHREMERPLSRFFDEVYLEACRCRLMASQRITKNG